MLCTRAANFKMSDEEGNVVEQREEANTSGATVNTILEAMRKMQDEILAVRRGQEEAAERSERRARKESYTFKRKGNELQFQFNDRVADKVAAAAVAIGKAEPASGSSKALLDRAEKELKEGMNLLIHRQKVIKLADRSEAGWTVVEEYEGDDLADDSEDERRMEKAEGKAEKKLAKKRKIKELRAKEERGAKSPGAFPLQRPFPGKGMEAAKGPSAPTRPTPRFPSRTCFECGESGHWRRECPKALAGSAYPLANCKHVGSEGKDVDMMNVSAPLSCSGDNGSQDVIEGVSRRCWEVQECEVHESSVRGRLKGCLAFWKEELDAPPWILDTIENGYVLPFYNEPEPYTRPNQKSALVERDFVNGAVADLLAGGYIEVAREVPHVCSPLSVITNQSGKKRLVVNLRHVNRSLWKQKFKYEDLRVVMMLFGPGVFTSGAWPLLSNLEDPELRRLAQALPATVLRSRADSTTKKYLGAYKRWKVWADARQGVPSFPVQELHLVLYMQHLSESTESKAAVEEAVHALSWLHGVAGLQPLGGSPLVKATLEGLRRILAKPKVRKEPVTADMLKAMVEAAGPAPSLTEVRLLAVCLVAFAGFMRCDELVKLKCEDITFNTESMVVRIVSSKTDQYREGSSLVIARTGEPTCPVGMMEKYFRMGELGKTPKECVFRGITVTKEGERLRKAGGLSYTRLRELLLSKISQLGFDPKLFGLHSLRAGGATAAANAGVPDRLFKRHGRWKSESAKDGYIKDSMEKRLKVSQQLGI